MKIEFMPSDSETGEIFDRPIPASHCLPEWYKTLDMYMNGIKNPRNEDMSNKNSSSNLSAKACVPLLDALTAGYMITLPADVMVTDENYQYRFLWDVNYELIGSHTQRQYATLQIPKEYEKDAFKFNNFWRIKTPPGYSCMFIHPSYRFDLPFYTLSGVVDTDTYTNLINFPFFLRKDFVGIIKKGTPIAQIIPFKRENWNSEIKKDDGKLYVFVQKLKTNMIRSYRNNFWKKKKYE